MSGLPELSEATKRKLVIQWDALVDHHRLTGQDLDRYASANDRIRQIAVSKAPATRSRWFDSWLLEHERAKRESGISPSVAVAKGRLAGLASEYRLLWESSGAGYEVHAVQLELLKGQVLAELASLWKGRSDATYRWYERVCAPAVEKELAALIKERIRQARDVELRRLECAPGTRRKTTGNPILDEIYAGGDDPEAIRRLIENGGDNLSTAAQEAIRKARGISAARQNISLSPSATGTSTSVEAEGVVAQPTQSASAVKEGGAETVANQGSCPESSVPSGSEHRSRRIPDLEISQKRLDLVHKLASELAVIKQDLKRHCTVEGLKRAHPEFALWQYLTGPEVKDLVAGEAFTPKAYAESLVLREFGITSRETLKKDRKKLRTTRPQHRDD